DRPRDMAQCRGRRGTGASHVAAAPPPGTGAETPAGRPRRAGTHLTGPPPEPGGPSPAGPCGADRPGPIRTAVARSGHLGRSARIATRTPSAPFGILLPDPLLDLTPTPRKRMRIVGLLIVFGCPQRRFGRIDIVDQLPGKV